jgi:DsbC/DsbD-like thiol-disulfide interchange protein
VLTPQQLSFKVSVTNNTQHTLKIDPDVVVFVDRRAVPVPDTGFSMSIAPGTHQEAVLQGPASKQIFQGNSGGTIVLVFNGVHTDPFNPSEQVKFQWDMNYTLSRLEKTMPVKERKIKLTLAQAKQLNGQIYAGEQM